MVGSSPCPEFTIYEHPLTIPDPIVINFFVADADTTDNLTLQYGINSGPVLEFGPVDWGASLHNSFPVSIQVEASTTWHSWFLCFGLS
jgi:hypothetical protein